MSLSINLLRFANEIIGKRGTINVDLGRGGYNLTITGDPITLNDIINAMEQIEEEFENYCWDNEGICPVADVVYNETKGSYVFWW